MVSRWSGALTWETGHSRPGPEFSSGQRRPQSCGSRWKPLLRTRSSARPIPGTLSDVCRMTRSRKTPTDPHAASGLPAVSPAFKNPNSWHQQVLGVSGRVLDGAAVRWLDSPGRLGSSQVCACPQGPQHHSPEVCTCVAACTAHAVPRRRRSLPEGPCQGACVRQTAGACSAPSTRVSTRSPRQRQSPRSSSV